MSQYLHAVVFPEQAGVWCYDAFRPYMVSVLYTLTKVTTIGMVTNHVS